MKYFGKNLTLWVFVLGLVGYLTATFFADPSWVQEPNDFYRFILLLKSSFLKLLRLLIAPLIFFSLIGGILNIGNANRLKRLGSVVMSYYVSTTIIAICIGLVAVFFIHPWENSDLTIKATAQMSQGTLVQTQQVGKFIDSDADSVVLVVQKMLDRALVNPVTAMSETNILGIVFNALLLGLGLLIVSGGKGPLVDFVAQMNQLIGKILGWIIWTSPIGIFAIVFDFTIKTGEGIFSQLLSFALLVFGATLFHGLIVLPTIAYFFGGKIKPLDLFRKIARPVLIAFGTASSSATLPITMKTCEEELGVDKGVSGFVFPLGATMNMDGTALFEGIAAVFLADLYGLELSNVAMASIFFMAMISSIGAPGMPSGSMSGMQMVLLAAGIPLEAIGVLMVIERPLDTFRTAVNVEGDIIGALVVQQSFEKKGFN